MYHPAYPPIYAASVTKKSFCRKGYGYISFQNNMLPPVIKIKNPKAYSSDLTFLRWVWDISNITSPLRFLSIIKTYNVFFIGTRLVLHLQVYNRQTLKLLYSCNQDLCKVKTNYSTVCKEMKILYLNKCIL